ncbi:hypothetical protein V1387_00700 [Allomuricauda taeanensis]|uniref:hypothetical protein n=1 Tax=Flagellimonas taeanensis TaxID=1005926 RepID=UPI002E7B53EB|nr:hypothetical protein [Allomuricauda taeanensis]MEE1961181.1 hypothetical protein [Allomuricauda taeanensis]
MVATVLCSVMGKIWKIIGRVAAVLTILGFILELFGIINLVPDTYQLSVYVKDDENNPVLVGQGRINGHLGNRPLNGTISDGGRVNFAEIVQSRKGDIIELGLEAEGWIIKGNKEFEFTGEPIVLLVEKNPNLGVIKGNVRNMDGSRFIPNVNITINSDTTIVSKPDGTFWTQLPKKFWVKSFKEPYNITIHKKGYKIKNELSYPNTETFVRLKEN